MTPDCPMSPGEQDSPDLICKVRNGPARDAPDTCHSSLGRPPDYTCLCHIPETLVQPESPDHAAAGFVKYSEHHCSEEKRSARAYRTSLAARPKSAPVPAVPPGSKLTYLVTFITPKFLSQNHTRHLPACLPASLPSPATPTPASPLTASAQPYLLPLSAV
ncbi:hypothetical protein E2C01_024582 [Portunus trituberculatus]|uniref:Uncharacterized protein n=1 Tax=Portunus trituberculatus TaxID=210409 RepID=A0A5B7ED42_PORTR|nr:hypothetical protein [Portunus trituberculatus]